MKKTAVLFIIAMVGCLQVHRPDRDLNCHSDLDCPIGWTCDFKTLKCIKGRDMFREVYEEPEEDINETVEDTIEETTICVNGSRCDDHDPCTYNDRCSNGVCKGQTYSCSSTKGCIIGICLGDGTCKYAIKPHYCLINNVCYKEGQPDPNNQCKSCVPQMSQYFFTNDDTLKCDDHDPDTTNDHCVAGKCVGDRGAK